MRISALTRTLALGTIATLAASAHAERKPPHAASHQVAALGGPAREDRAAPSLTTGDLALTGQTDVAHKEPFLSARDITALVAPRRPEIQRCYLDGITASQRPSRLDLTFVIARDGDILSLHMAAPGVPARTAHKIEGCIRTAIDGLQFPARRKDTTAVVPYFFQKTVAPDAGPRPSCWNPKGC